MPQRTLEQIHVDLVKISENLENYVLDGLVDEISALILTEDEKKTAKGWRKGRGNLAFKSTTITVDVYRKDDYPGLMINRRYSEDCSLLAGWTISHELSGISLTGTRKIYKNMRQAAKAVDAHLADVNWDQLKEDILNDPKAKEACYKLFDI